MLRYWRKLSMLDFNNTRIEAEENKKIMQEKSRIANQVKQNITTYFNLQPIDDLNIKIVVKRHSHTYWKRIYLCKIETTDKRLGKLTKYVFGKKSPDREYVNMKTLWNLFASQGENDCFPRPLEYINDIRVILMEHAEGEIYLNYLIKNLLPILRTIRYKDMVQKIHRVADWLVTFQKITYSNEEKNLKEEVDDVIDKLKVIPYFTKAEKETILKRIEDIYPSVPPSPMILSGEFTPRNMIFKNDNKLIVLDWEQLRERNIYYDVHQFLTNLESRARLPIYSISYIKNLEDDFLNQYFSKTDFGRSDELYNFTKVLYYIEYLYRYQLMQDSYFKNKPTILVDHFTRSIAQKILRILSII